MIANNEFVEHAAVHSNFYGTSKAVVEAVSETQRICILDIDIQGAQKVKAVIPQAKFVFVMPPSLEVLENRLRGRGTEKEEKIQLRLNNARKEIEAAKEKGFFDYVLQNNELAKAVEDVSEVLRGWYPSLPRCTAK